SSKDPLLRQLYDKVMSSDTSNFPSSIGEGLERACTTQYAFLAPLISVVGLAKELPCRISMLPYVFMKAGLPFATPKNSTYRRLFNHKIRQMWDSGIFALIMTQKLPKILYEEPKSISVNLNDVTPILALLAVGILVAWCVLLLEMTKKRHRNH
ncbi:unnamed protein product, partial [Timema podura]|nr:unnamed protein product [Timema podura]